MYALCDHWDAPTGTHPLGRTHWDAPTHTPAPGIATPLCAHVRLWSFREGSHRFLVELLEAYELEGTAGSVEAADVAAQLVVGAVGLPVTVTRAALGKLAAVRLGEACGAVLSP